MSPTLPTAIEFAPSSGYSFEPEFTGPPPRHLPDNLLHGPYARESRANIVRVFALGLTCFVLPFVPGVDTLSYYLLPLGYLHWIGLAALAIAAGGAFHYALRLGPFRYVREGEPLVVRVTQLGLEASSYGHGIAHYKAQIVYRHPQTGALTHSIVKTKDLSVLQQRKYDPRLKPGDYVTAVYLPGKKIEKSLRLYAFLDLSPDVNIRADVSSPSAAFGALRILGFAALMTVLIGNAYAMERYEPLEAIPVLLVIPAAVGAVLLASLAVWLGPANASASTPARQRLWTALSGLLIGAMSGGCWGLMANAWLDRSPAVEQPATVVKFWTKTHYGIVRMYETEYRLEDTPKTRRLLTTLEDMRRFEHPRAVARIRQGAFGWKWVESLEPMPMPATEEETSDGAARP
jgi:hypothetical protein